MCHVPSNSKDIEESNKMAARTKLDLSSSRGDGLAYLSAQHGPYAAGSLEQSGSFHESIENHASFLLPSVSRSSTMLSQCDVVNLFQFLLSDLKSVVLDRKVHRPGELKKVMAFIIGVSPDDYLAGTHSVKPLPALSVEELKRIRANLHEYSIKARDRAKKFGDAASKIDKYYKSILPRKRSRSDTSSSERSNQFFQGGSTIKTVGHLSAAGLQRGTQKTEEKEKTAVPNRRIRTSMAEVRMDGRGNGTGRTSRLVDRDKNMFSLENGSAILSEEKGKALTTGIDGWDKSKMKKKRSGIKLDTPTSAILSEPLDGDEELNNPPRLGHDARPRLNNSEVLRLNAHEANTAANPGSVTKVNASSRASRSISDALLKASSNIRRAVGNSDKLEVPQCQNKFDTIVGTNNLKRSEPICSSSAPVTQWVGQRLQKMSRVARRSNFQLASSRDEVPTSDIIDNATVDDEGMGYSKHLSSNASKRSKVKGDHVSFTGLSESGGSRVAENKPRDGGKKLYEIAEKTGQDVQVETPVLHSSKNKVSSDEDLGGGFHRQGRTVRSFALKRSARATTVGKLDNTATAKQLRSAILGSEITESKAGHPPTKKYEYLHPRHAVNDGSAELAGESDDDHEELLAAASSALESRHACSGPSDSVWKQMEWVFDFISAEDASYLNQQIKLLDESPADTCFPANYNYNSKGGVNNCSIPSTPAIACKDDCSGITNGTCLNEHGRDLGLVGQTKHVDTFFEQLVHGTGTHNGISVYQALLSALIEEDDIEEVKYSVSRGENCINTDTSNILYGLDSEVNTRNLNMQSFENFQNVERASSNGYRENAIWSYNDEMEHIKLESDGSDGGRVEPKIEAILNILHSQEAPSNISCSEYEYNQLCINDRILLELKAIGLHPESLPDLARSEDDGITEGITKLEKMLHQQVMMKKDMLLKVEKVVNEAKELQKRELEQIALDKLIRMAYDKHMAIWGPNNTGGKSVNKIREHAVLAFVKRTLERCRKYEETGRSSFSEPEFRDLFLSVSSSSNITDCVDNPDGHTRRTSQLRKKINALDKDDPCLIRVKKRELLLNDVVGNSVSSLRASTVLGSSLVNGTKGKRSERDRDRKGHNKEATSGNGTASIGRPAVSNIKGEGKNKTKPKQKTTQLSASLSGPFGKSSDLPKTILPPTLTSREMAVDGNVKEKDGLGLTSCGIIQHVSDDAEAIDLANLQIPEIDVLGVTDDLSGPGQDIASWLSIDDDGLHDLDLVGLQIPMDDLSELNMAI